MVDVHEGNLGTDIIPEAVEFFRIFFSINSVEGSGCFLQDGNGLLGCRGSENPVMVAQMDDVSFLFMGSRKTFSILPEVTAADGIFSGNQGSCLDPAHHIPFILWVGRRTVGAGLCHHHFGWYAAVHGFGNT